MASEFPMVKLSSTISGFFLTVHTGLFFMSVSASIGLFQSINPLISPLRMLNISIVGMIIGAIMHYIVATYFQWKYEGDNTEAITTYLGIWIFVLVVYVGIIL